MERLLEGLWNPLLGGFVLCAGLLLMVGTGVLPLRRLGRVARGWRVGTPSAPAILVATSASLTTITAAVMAVNVAGPGALVWMWIAGLLGVGLHFGEAKLARQAVAQDKPALPGWATVGLLAVALLSGGMWQGSQAGLVLEASLELPAVFGAAAVAVIALGASRMPSLTTLAIRWMPLLGLTAFVAVVIGSVSADPLALQLALGDAVNEAFGLQSATAGTVGGALSVLIAQGMMRAVCAADIGVGAAAAAVTHHDEALSPDDAGASVMLVPMLVIGVLATLAGLTVLSAPPEPSIAAAIVKKGARAKADSKIRLHPLERSGSRGLRASKQVGQTVVLPADTPMEKGREYAMMLRADPRGHKMAKLLDRENSVILPNWAVSAQADTVTFRARDPRRAKQAAWDVVVPCNRELFGGENADQFVRLTPKDPELVFSKFTTFRELDPAPYVNVGDFKFVGSVALANSPDEELGEHLAMFEYRGEDTAFNPRLHEFFRNQYSGPFPDVEGEVPPMAFAAIKAFDAEIGSQVSVELRADARGIDILRVNRVGTLEAPPWNALMDLHEIVIRHADGPAQDIRIPVAGRLDGQRIRLDVLDPDWEDLRKIAKDDKLSGPFAVLPNVPLTVEVHGGSRLPPAAEGRQSLVPIHDDPRPRGPQERELYDPHPAELLAAGFSPPYRPGADVRVLVRRVQKQQPDWGGQLLGIAALLLAASTTLGWALLVREPARQLLGQGGQVLVPLAVCALPILGGLLASSLVDILALFAYAFAAVPVIGVLVLNLARVRDSSRN